MRNTYSSFVIQFLFNFTHSMCGRANVKKYDLWIALNQPTTTVNPIAFLSGPKIIWKHFRVKRVIFGNDKLEIPRHFIYQATVPDISDLALPENDYRESDSIFVRPWNYVWVKQVIFCSKKIENSRSSRLPSYYLQYIRPPYWIDPQSTNDDREFDSLFVGPWNYQAWKSCENFLG